MRNALGEDDDGRRLLRCIRAYVELDLLASFDVHTDKTIEYGRAVVTRFSKLMNVSQLFCIRKDVTIVNMLELSGIRQGGLELSQNAFNSTPL